MTASDNWCLWVVSGASTYSKVEGDPIRGLRARPLEARKGVKKKEGIRRQASGANNSRHRCGKGEASLRPAVWEAWVWGERIIEKKASRWGWGKETDSC